MEKREILSVGAIIVLAVVIFVASLIGVALISDLEIKDVFLQFYNSTIGSSFGILTILGRMSFLLMVSLGLSIAFGSGVWNLGGEGQILWGGIVTVGIALHLGFSPIMAGVLAFILSFIVGGGWGLIAGALKARWNVNEMVSTLMLNFVALATMIQLSGGPWRDQLVLIPQTRMIPEALRFPFISYPLNVIFLISIVFIPLVYVLMRKTVLGYEMRVVGSRPTAAAAAGISISKITTLCMFLSGGVIALTGTMLVFGHFFRAEPGMTGTFGFYAIVSTLLGRNKPQLMPLTTFILALIITGTNGLRVMGIPGAFTDVVIGFLFIISILPEIYSRRG
ncbi:MAG: ABC transporter permease [Candidatus Bathyarchaeia archaeon]